MNALSCTGVKRKVLSAPRKQKSVSVLPLQREAPDAEALEEDTVGA